jgi:muramidase (phage lysozyme)
MADSELERGPAVGTSLHENIAEGYQKLGNVVQEPFKPGVTGAMVYEQAMDRGRAITALANGISEGFAPFVDKLASNFKDQNTEASTQAGLTAGAAAGAGVAGPSTVAGAGQQPATTPGQPPPSPTPTQAPGAPAAGQPDSGSQIARGANGLSSVLPSFPAIFGGGLFGPDKNYTHAVGVGAAATAGLQIDQDLNAMRTKYNGDPEGFKNGAAAYLGNLQLSGVPNGAQIRIGGMKSASEYYNGMVTQKAAQDVKASGLAVDAQIGRLTDDTNALLRNGAGVDTPEVAGKIAQIHTLYSNYAANPAFGIPRSQVDEELHQKDLQFQGTAMVGQVDQQFHANGATAARAFVENWKNNSTLPDKDREIIGRQGGARIDFNTGQNADGVAANKSEFDNLLKMDQSKVPQGAYEHIRDTATSLGDPATAQTASGVLTLRPQHPATLGQTPAQAQRADGLTVAPNGAVAATPVAAVGPTSNIAAKDIPPEGAKLLNALSGPESGGSYNTLFGGEKFSSYAQHPWEGRSAPGGHSDSGKYQFTLSTWHEAQRALGLTDFTPASQDRAAWWLAQRDYKSNTGNNLDTDLQAGKFNPRGLQNTWVSIRNLGADNWSRRYFGAASDKLGGGQGAQESANGVPFTAEQLAANPYLAAASVRLAATDQTERTKQFNLLDAAINNSIKNNVAPPASSLTEYAQLASSNPDNDGKFQKTAAAVTTWEGTKADIGAGGGGGAIGGLIDQSKQDAANSPDIWHQQVALTRKEQLEGWAKDLKDDPAGASMRAEWTSRMPRPIDYNNPATVAPGLAERAQIQNGIAARQGGAPGSAIFPAELAGAKDVLANGAPQQKMALLAGISALPSPIREKTFGALAETGASGAAFAQAGHVASFNPAAANDIMQGQALLANEPRLAPKTEDLQASFAKNLPPTDLSSPDARGRIMDAAKAYYAAQMAKRNDVSQTLDEGIWKQSLDAVTGGVLEYRGTKIIAPVPGMSQPQFESRLGALQDGDMQGATVGGQPFPASALKPYWGFHGTGQFRLQTLDPDSGKYLVIAGPSTSPQKVSDGNGRPLVLDLTKQFTQ